MSLAAPEDAASVLEQFTHDVANTPAEITHLMEEIQAKDMQIAAFKDEINKRDMALQKWVRQNGGNVLNPKEEAFSKTINDCYDKCEILQAEKEGLATKALLVLDRQVRRLDINLRSLAAREEFPSNWDGPSLLSGSATGVSTPVAPVNAGPLQAVSGNIGTTGGAANIANAAQLRMAQSSQAARSGQQTPTANVGRSQRESSTDASKRRRLNATLSSLPTAGSSLRQSSLGPGTPKAGTPTGTSRAGSAQPPRAGALLKKVVPLTKKVAPHQAAASSRNRKRPNKKGDRRRALARDRATPSTNASLSDSDGESTSPTPSSMPQQDAAVDHGEDDEDDEQLYCFCQKVSFGNMVGCDNDNCEYQWFHWDCIGLKSEPTGEWLCPECRKLPRKDLVISREEQR